MPHRSRAIAERTLNKRYGKTPSFPGNSGNNSASHPRHAPLVDAASAGAARSRSGPRPSNPIFAEVSCTAYARSRATAPVPHRAISCRRTYADRRRSSAAGARIASRLIWTGGTPSSIESAINPGVLVGLVSWRAARNNTPEDVVPSFVRRVKVPYSRLACFDCSNGTRRRQSECRDPSRNRLEGQSMA